MAANSAHFSGFSVHEDVEAASRERRLGDGLGEKRFRIFGASSVEPTDVDVACTRQFDLASGVVDDDEGQRPLTRSKRFDAGTDRAKCAFVAGE